ncbi:MAG: MjaI family restriction endonuclease [Bacteroidota bacterium]|nr:MjaI family restriction endonuclease [Bacteroidota bacterium]
MPKEWILNSATNRFQLNFKRNVGAVSEAIRKCKPKNLEDWKTYYFENVRSKQHIGSLRSDTEVKYFILSQ